MMAFLRKFPEDFFVFSETTDTYDSDKKGKIIYNRITR